MIGCLPAQMLFAIFIPRGFTKPVQYTYSHANRITLIDCMNQPFYLPLTNIYILLFSPAKTPKQFTTQSSLLPFLPSQEPWGGLLCPDSTDWKSSNELSWHSKINGSMWRTIVLLIDSPVFIMHLSKCTRRNQNCVSIGKVINKDQSWVLINITVIIKSVKGTTMLSLQITFPIHLSASLNINKTIILLIHSDYSTYKRIM